MKIAFISGHMDITHEEFMQHYVPAINAAIARGDSFVVGDANGTDKMAFNHLTLYSKWDNIRVFHIGEKPRYKTMGYITRGGFASDETRDAAMTVYSDYDIAWVRPGRSKRSGTARNIARRRVKSSLMLIEQNGKPSVISVDQSRCLYALINGLTACKKIFNFVLPEHCEINMDPYGTKRIDMRKAISLTAILDVSSCFESIRSCIEYAAEYDDIFADVQYHNSELKIVVSTIEIENKA